MTKRKLPKADSEAIERFMEEELERMSGRQTRAHCRVVRDRISELTQLTHADWNHHHILVTCMDERGFRVPESLGLVPGFHRTFATAGGKISAEDFRLFNEQAIRTMTAIGTRVSVYLVPHESGTGHPQNGCAAFNGDGGEQRRYFSALQAELRQVFPEAMVSLLMFDTDTDTATAIEADPRDERLAQALTERTDRVIPEPTDLGHAGYGIYLGMDYRKWVEDGNTYLQLTPLNINLERDLMTAFRVILYHSSTDLSVTPIVIHADFPKTMDEESNEFFRQIMVTVLMRFTEKRGIKEMFDEGRIRIVSAD